MTSGPNTITVVADPTVIVTVDDPNICEGGNALFTAAVSNGSGPSSYQWQYNDVGNGGWQAGKTSYSYVGCLSK